MRKADTVSLGVGVALLVASGVAWAGSEGFDSGQGIWEKGTYNTILEYHPEGGNPGGFMLFRGDSKIGLATKQGPFVGDYAAAGYNEISVDLNVQLMPVVQPKPEVYIRAGSAVAGWAYRLTAFTPQGGVWQHLSAPMNSEWSDAEAIAAGWKRDTGAAISFADTMRQVWNMGVRLAYVPTTSAFIGVDNISVHVRAEEPAPTGDDTGASSSPTTKKASPLLRGPRLPDRKKLKPPPPE